MANEEIPSGRIRKESDMSFHIYRLTDANIRRFQKRKDTNMIFHNTNPITPQKNETTVFRFFQAGRVIYQIGISYPLFGRIYQAVHTYLCMLK